MALSKFKQDEIAFELAHETKRNVAVKTVSTQDALAMACAALRINGAYLKDTRRFSCEENKTQFANKDLVKFAFEEDTVKVSNLGRVAYIPEFVKRDKHETGLKKEIRVEYRSSTYLGKEKDMVEGVVKILDKRFSAEWESYNYTAVMDGNLVSFMNKYDHEVGAMKRVKGKVKAQTKNKLFGADETRLNYVKLYKV